MTSLLDDSWSLLLSLKTGLQAKVEAVNRSPGRLCTKSHSACEAGVSIKPGAQAPGSDYKDMPEPVKTGDCVKFFSLSPAIAGSCPFIWHVNLGLAPRLYAYACYRRLRNIMRFRLLEAKHSGEGNRGGSSHSHKRAFGHVFPKISHVTELFLHPVIRVDGVYVSLAAIWQYHHADGARRDLVLDFI